MGTAIIEKLPRNNRFVMFCDFCGASQKEVSLLISSPNGNHICDECIDVSVAVVQDQQSKVSVKLKGQKDD